MIVQRVAFLVAALLIAPVLLVTWIGDGVTPLLKILCTVILIITTVSPASGLLVIAGVVPISTQIQVLAGAPMGGAQVAEMLIAAFLFPASIRLALTGHRPLGGIERPAIVLGAVVAASGVVHLAVEQQATALPAAYLHLLGEHVTRTYFWDVSAFPSLHLSMFWIEALMLSVVAERLLHQDSRRHSATVRMMIVGAAAAGSFATIRLIEVSLRNPDAWSSAIGYVRTLRINPHYSDLNAAGSYYALFLLPAVWLLGKRRSVWLGLITTLLVLALWLTGSRAAQVAAVFVLATAWAIEHRPRRPYLIAGAAIAVVVAGLALVPQGRVQASIADAFLVRLEILRTGMRIAASHPFVGVGLGEFIHLTGPVTDPTGVVIVPGGENAHNQFLQILAELGAVGLGTFLWMLISLSRDVVRSTKQAAPRPELVGLGSGIVAFLVSCLLGHPLLMPQVLLLFFLAIGVTAGLVPEPASAVGSRTVWAIAVALAVLVVSVPFRADAARRAAVLDNVTIGVSSVRDTVDNVRYRAVEPRAVWFVAATTKSVTLPLRQAPGTTTACHVTITLDGASMTEVTPAADQWLRLDLPLPAPARPRASRAIGVTSEEGCQLIAGPIVKK